MVNYCKSFTLQGRTENSLWNSLIMNYRLLWLVASQRAVGCSCRAPVPQRCFGLTNLCTTLQFICKLAQPFLSSHTCWLPEITTVKLYPWNEILSFSAHTELYWPHREYSTYNQGLNYIFFTWSKLIKGIKGLSAELWIQALTVLFPKQPLELSLSYTSSETELWKVIEKLDIYWLVIHSIRTILWAYVFIVF